MEVNQLPTNPGPYYWRENDGDEWEMGNVFENYDKRFYFEVFNIVGKPVVDMGGQWLPIPTADELVELLWRVHNVLDDPSTIELRHLGEYVNKLRKGMELDD